MARKGWSLMIAVVVAFCMAAPTIVSGVVAAPEKGKRCSDGIDNDGDGLIDEADPDCAGDDGGGGGGTSVDNIFSLEIRDTPNLKGDNPDFELKSLYVDQRLAALRADADECVTGNQQNTRGNDTRYGAFLDLDRGSAETGDPDFAECNEYHALGTEPLDPPFRRTVMMVIPDSCACGVLGAEWEANSLSCTVTPDVVGMVGQPDDANPRVTATQVVGNRSDESLLRIMWRVPEADGGFANYTVVSASEIPFTRNPTTWDGAEVERIEFTGTHAFEFRDPDSTCSGSFDFEVDVTYLHQQCVLDAEGNCESIQ